MRMALNLLRLSSMGLGADDGTATAGAEVEGVTEAEDADAGLEDVEGMAEPDVALLGLGFVACNEENELLFFLFVDVKA